jgi:hypothetical protein
LNTIAGAGGAATCPFGITGKGGVWRPKRGTWAMGKF